MRGGTDSPVILALKWLKVEKIAKEFICLFLGILIYVELHDKVRNYFSLAESAQICNETTCLELQLKPVEIYKIDYMKCIWPVSISFHSL